MVQNEFFDDGYIYTILYRRVVMRFVSASSRLIVIKDTKIAVKYID